MQENLFEIKKRKLETVKCLCLKKGVPVTIKPSIDPRFLFGKCWRCNKIHTKKKEPT